MEAGKDNFGSVFARHFKRYWRPFLTRTEKIRIAELCAEQESRTTGEIHVYTVARAGKRDMLQFAQQKFHELGMDKAPARNGVLILISRWDHQFAIWGDEGLHASAGQPLWERAKQTLLACFSAQQYAEGIEACVREVGDELAHHFPKKG